MQYCFLNSRTVFKRNQVLELTGMFKINYGIGILTLLNE
jgi:hypothetical protein